jgi:hypothetical protein
MAEADVMSDRAFLEVADCQGDAVFDQQQCVAAGAMLHDGYVAAQPFPHVVIDDFLPDWMLRDVLREFPSDEGLQYFDRAQERLKFQYHPQACGPRTRHLLAELNSQAFLAFLTAVTGIKGLIPDPYFVGGGLHETKRGGHLGIHADFNIHPKMHVVRRLNLLIYLNENWDPAFGGDLELWDRAMTRCELKVAPVFGRALLFNTDLDSFHGHPDPMPCPAERSRRSIALYYYTSPAEGLQSVPVRTTNFKARPQSVDRVDWKVAARHFINDWTPPALRRIGVKGSD